MSTTKTEQKTLWEQIATSLITELETELPGRRFDFFVTQHDKKTIYEMDPITHKHINNLLIFREEKNTIGIFKSFKNKKDHLLSRIIIDRVSEKFELHREPGYFGPFIPFNKLSCFDILNDNNPLSYVRDLLYSIYKNLEKNDNFHFSMNHTGNILLCNLDGFNFALTYYLTPSEIEFNLSSDIYKNKENDFFNLPFSVPLTNLDTMSFVITSKANELHLTTLFSSKPTSFLKNEIKSKFSPSGFPFFYNDDEKFLTSVLSFLTKETGFNLRELETQHLNSINSPRNQYITFGDYQLSISYPSHSLLKTFVFDTENHTAESFNDFEVGFGSCISLYLSEPLQFKKIKTVDN